MASCCFSADEPDKIVCARIGNAGGVVIGLGEGENFIASDIPAILEHTRKVIFLESRQMAVITKDDVQIETLEGQSGQRPKCTPLPGMQFLPKRANTATSCRRKSTSRCAR